MFYCNINAYIHLIIHMAVELKYFPHCLIADFPTCWFLKGERSQFLFHHCNYVFLAFTFCSHLSHISFFYLSLSFTVPLSESLQFQAQSKHSGVWDWGLWGHQGYVMTAQVRGLTLEGSPSLSARGLRRMRKHGRWKSECWEWRMWPLALWSSGSILSLRPVSPVLFPVHFLMWSLVLAWTIHQTQINTSLHSIAGYFAHSSRSPPHLLLHKSLSVRQWQR